MWQMCNVAPGMGSGWEANIARLIDQANETLSSSAHSRQHKVVGHGSERSTGASSPYRGNPSFFRSSPTTFRGNRSASYRRGSGSWDASLLVDRPSARPFGFSAVDSTVPPIPPPASFSRSAGARVDSAKIDGMEDRVRLEVQTAVRRDVSACGLRPIQEVLVRSVLSLRYLSLARNNYLVRPVQQSSNCSRRLAKRRYVLVGQMGGLPQRV